MRSFSLITKVILAVLALFAVVIAVGAHNSRSIAQSSERGKSAWVTELITMRTKTDTNNTKPRFSNWYATSWMPHKDFSQKFFPESGVDLSAKSDDGKALWTKHTNWMDGRIENLPIPDNTTIYLYRTVESPVAQSLEIGVGSDDGIELWLNGELLLSDDASHGAEANQYNVTLKLKAGENALLMKIHNNGAQAGFYFGYPGMEYSFDERAKELFAKFPVEMDWFMQDGPGKMSDWVPGSMDGKGDLAAYMSTRTDAGFEQKLIEKATSELGKDRQAIEQKLQELVKANVGPNDRRWMDLYVQACQKRRLVRLQPLLKAAKQVIFTKHPTFGRDSGIYIITENAGANPKSALCSLNLAPELAGDGHFATISTLIEAKDGVRDPDVSYDGKRLIFAWRKAGAKGQPNYQIQEMELATGKIRQLTTDETYGASFEPTYLPNGDIMFSSSRIVQHITCGWGDCSNLFIMNKDGKYARRVGFDQTNTAFAHVLEDGRVIFTRRDYNDRGQVWAHKLFQMNPDGTEQREFWGNSSYHPTTFQHARGIPGTKKVITIIGGYHTDQGGKLAQIDLERGRQEPDGVYLIPSGEVPKMKQTSGDSYGKEGDQYQYPYPIDKNSFLVCYTLGGLMYSNNNAGMRRENEMPYSIYFMTMDGKRELLATDPDISCLQPVPIMPRPVPHMRPSTVDYSKDTAVCSVSDVYAGQSVKGVERGVIKKLRVVEIKYKTLTNGGTVSGGGPGGYGHSVTPIATNSGTYDAKAIIGDAKVYEDGSACFTIPARVPVYFQLLDDKNRVVQTMRSWATLMPNEKLSCVGCHETKQQAPQNRVYTNLALRAGPQALQPFYGPTRGFSFRKEIQPIFNKHCVSCHNPSGKNSKFLLTDDEEIDPTNGDTANPHRRWMKSYRTLTGWPLPSQRYYTGNEIVNWYGRLGAITLHPAYEAGSVKSKLIDMMYAGHNGVKLSQEEIDKLEAWIDLNVPYLGEYDEANTWSDSMKREFEKRAVLRKANEEIDRRNIEAYIKAGQK